MGGMSSEHEVSLASGTKVADSLDAERYHVIPIRIGLDGLWWFPEKGALEVHDAVAEMKRMGIECAFIVLHGAFGEDGRLQGLLDLVGIPYTSSGCAASALAMDKLRSKAVVRQAGIRVAEHVMFLRREWDADSAPILLAIREQVGFPCVVKSPCQGSSVGMMIPQNVDELCAGLPEVTAYGEEVMVEAFISGTEVTCAVLDVEPGKKPRALPVTEIRPVSSKFFDYHAKYTPGASKEITPAEIPADITAAVQAMAVKVHEAIGCTVWSRSDMIIDEKGPVWLEVNTVPGMTPTSLYPQAAAAAGISYRELVALFVESALARKAPVHKGS